jgi:outer membrane protein, heavy metal efflux system
MATFKKRVIPLLIFISIFLMGDRFQAFAAGEAAALETLLKEAQRMSPGLQAKKSAYEAARSKVIASWLPEDPVVGVDVEGQSDLLKTGSRTDYEYMASQTIPFPTKLFLNGVMASKEADMAYQMYKEEQRAIAWRIEQPSYQLFLSQRTILALEETQKLVEQLSSVVRSRYEANQTNQSDYLKVQIELEQISIEIFDWRQQSHIAEAAISRQLNRPLSTSYPIDSEVKRLPLSLSLADLEKMALGKRPELKSFEAAVERAKAARLFSQTEWLPDITGRVEAMQMKGEGDISRYDNFVGVSVPVWSLLKGAGGGWHSAQKEVEAAQSLYTDMKNETLFRVHEAYAKFKSAENALNIYESLILPQSKSQVDIALSSYEAGRVDILDLIDAERTFKNTQMGYYKAMSDYEMALSDLRLAVGDDLKGQGENS